MTQLANTVIRNYVLHYMDPSQESICVVKYIAVLANNEPCFQSIPKVASRELQVATSWQIKLQIATNKISIRPKFTTK